MFKPFQLKSRFSTGVVSSLLLLGSLTGCGVQDAAREIPKANAILQLLHAQDRSVIQIKLQQCQVGNLFAGQTGTSSKYDLLNALTMNISNRLSKSKRSIYGPSIPILVGN